MRKHVTVAISGGWRVTSCLAATSAYAGAAPGAPLPPPPPVHYQRGWFHACPHSCMTQTDGRHGFSPRPAEFAQSGNGRLKKTCTSTGSAIFLKQKKTRPLYFCLCRRGWRPRFRRFSPPVSSAGAHNWSRSAAWVMWIRLRSCAAIALNMLTGMSMANSLEVRRALFTDYSFAGICHAGCQKRMKVRNMTTKWITRQALKNTLPQEVLTKKKMGFNPPLPQWNQRRA